MKTNWCKRLLAMVLCACMLFSGGVLAEETVEAITESVIEEVTEESVAEVSYVEEPEEAPAEENEAEELPELKEAQVIMQDGWGMGENDALIIPYNAGTEEITFSWTKVEGAVSYRVETAHISESGAPEGIQEIGNVAEASITLPVAAYSNGWYALGIVAEAEDGRQSVCMQVFRLQEKYLEEDLPADETEAEEEEVAEDTDVSEEATALQILVPPQSVTVAEGQKATVTVNAVGDGLTYTWYIRDTTSTTYTKSSIKSNSYSVVMNAARNGRRLICYVSDMYGNRIQCPTVMIKMGTKLQITKQPESVTVANGKTATISLTAVGDGLTYTWYASDVGDNNVYYQSPSQKSNTYSVTMDDVRAGRKVYCIVEDKYGIRIKSDTVTLNRAAGITIITPPKSVTVQEGEKATVSVVASGEELTYAWYMRDANSNNYYKSSITTNTYSVIMNESRNGRRLICYVYDKYGNRVQCPTVMIKMAKPLEIIQQPQSVTVAEGEKATVSVLASGDGLTYAWYFKDANAGTYSKSSITTNTYSVVMNASRSGRRLICYVYDKYGNRLQCNTVVIKMKTPLEIISQPQDVTVEEGANARVTVQARGDGLTYTWYASDVEDNGVYYQSYTITGNSYSVAMNSVRNGRKVYCKITDAYGDTVTSRVAVLRMVSDIELEQPWVYVYGGDEKGTIEVCWEEVENAEGYYIYRSDDEEATYSKIATVNSGSAVEYMDTGLPGRSYFYYKVQAFANGGAVVSPMSESDWGTTFYADIPQNLTVTQVAAGTVRVEWDPVDDIDGYILDRATDADFTENLESYFIEPDCNYYIDYDIESGVTYYYSVFAYQEDGEAVFGSGYSDAVAYSEGNTVKYRALLIGNTYPGTINELDGPDNDVNAMYKMLSSMNASPYETSYVYNASAASIKNNISYAFSSADENDVSLFYYSGHGTSSGSLCGTDGAYVTVSQLRSALDAIPGKKIVILDSCYSGAHINKTYGDGTIDYSAFNDAVVSAFSAKNRTLTTNDYVVLTACSKTQTSLSLGFELDDGSDFWFGLLTYGVTEGSGFEMLGGSYCERYADTDSNDKITLGETYTYCVELVESLGYTQNTQYYGDTSFVLWKD